MTLDEMYMRRCFQLAECGKGHAAPNPMVGAVIVCDGEIIGEGYHRKCGGPHAEVNAVASVVDKSKLSRSTMYVSLEPCAHWGKTPPCAELIIKHRIPKVVICNVDPFPKVDGRGVQMLQDAGVEVKTGVLADEGWHLNRRFFTFHSQRRPYIILKWAESADGFIAGKNGEPIKISTPETMRYVHKLRSEESGILVGMQTALNDNPSLTVRHWSGENPTRILLDRNLIVPADSKCFSSDAETIVVTEKSNNGNYQSNVKVATLPFDTNGVQMEALMKCLYESNIQSIIVEGGARTLQAFINAGIWDEARVERNPRLFIREGVSAPRFVVDLDRIEEIDGNLITYYRNQK